MRKGPRPRPVLERLLEKCEWRGDCLEWTRYTDPKGYGRINVEGRDTLAHRAMWMEMKGPIPDGLQVCHTCDNPPCLRIEHLWLGTNEQNQADCIAKGRRKGAPQQEFCQRGHPMSEAIVLATGRRQCRECAYERRRQWKARQ